MSHFNIRLLMRIVAALSLATVAVWAFTARSAPQLDRALRRAQLEAQLVYGNTRLYVEQLISPAHLIGVQIIADQSGHIVHLGEREGSL